MIDLDRRSPEFACKAIEFLLQEAIARRASDIHFQPRSDHLEVLFRVDGVLTKFGEIPSGLETDPMARLLVLANLPTYQSKKPQEGRLRETPLGIEMRLGTFPTVHGTRAVVRLLNRDDSLITISVRVARLLHELVFLWPSLEFSAFLTARPITNAKF